MCLAMSFLYSEVIPSRPNEGKAPDKLHLPLAPTHPALGHRSITEGAAGGGHSLVLVGEKAASSLPEVVDRFCIL